jgi:deazaflavin-dependent oxidoreductase (nitroreductase family)
MWFNNSIKPLLRSPLHGLVSRNMMLVTLKGRRSGRTYSFPVNYVQEGDTLWTVSLRERSWWRNLRGGAPVTLRLRGRDVRAEGRVSEDDQTVAEDLATLLRLAPGYARYLEVALDQASRPRQDDLLRAAQSRVVIRFSPARSQA